MTSSTIATKAENAPIYQRKGDYIPRVAAVHDLCGYGKCSLGVAIPVLSAAGCDVCPVPTSLFSAHTAFPHFYMHDTTVMLSDYLCAWDKEGVEIDAVYSGFLGAAEQVDSIKHLYDRYPSALRILDPVMGDGGKIYPTYTDELCCAMRNLLKGADLLCPNLTEASILTQTPYQGQAVDEEFVRTLMDKLLSLGAKRVVLKGIIQNGAGTSSNRAASHGGKPVVLEPQEGEACRESEANQERQHSVGKKRQLSNYYQSQDSELIRVDVELLPYMLHGTGDLFCSALFAALMCEKSPLESLRFAGDFVLRAMKLSCKQPDFKARGVSFEPLLGKIAGLLQD